MARKTRSSKSEFGALPKATAEAAAIMTAAPFVIASRLTGFWLSPASPSAKDRAEATRMVTEKMMAAQESAMAMNAAVSAAAWKSVIDTMSTGIASTGNIADDVLTAGLKPYGKRVRSNRKRLSKG